MDTAPINVLLVEDDEDDAFLEQDMLAERPGRFKVQRASRLADAMVLLDQGEWGVILLDLGLPDSDGLSAVSELRDRKPEIPLIVLTGLADEDVGIAAMKRGAQDYLVKGHINGDLLRRAILYALERKSLENERERLIIELKQSMENVRLLSGLLPICAQCKKIRDDSGYWEQLESYVSKHSDVMFSHGLCPECASKLYPEFHRKLREEGKGS